MRELLNDSLYSSLCCPCCKGDLERADKLKCLNSMCAMDFPIIDGVPVLINGSNSLFKIEDYIESRDTTYKTSTSKLKKLLKRMIPSLGFNIKSKRNFEKLFTKLKKEQSEPKILIVGGAVLGKGIESKFFENDTTIVEMDVAFGIRTNLISDAHDISLKDETFDLVIVQAVLEHVLDPNRCVEEIHRVLKKDGMVYAETPFMYQVHAGRFDFTRFTHLGHRRLFRHFSEIESGAVGGPATVLALSYCYFLQSFFKSKLLYQAVYVFACVTAFWLKYVDYILIDKPGAFDAASGYYFCGRKSEKLMSDVDLIASYKGMIK